MADIWALDDGTVVRRYRPPNGMSGEVFMHGLCDRCQSEPDSLEDHDGCPIIALTMALEVTDPEYPTEWVERVSDGHAFCTAFQERPAAWDGVPVDPHAVAAKKKSYDALPRDPITGRPVI